MSWNEQDPITCDLHSSKTSTAGPLTFDIHSPDTIDPYRGPGIRLVLVQFKESENTAERSIHSKCNDYWFCRSTQTERELYLDKIMLFSLLLTRHWASLLSFEPARCASRVHTHTQNYMYVNANKYSRETWLTHIGIKHFSVKVCISET